MLDLLFNDIGHVVSHFLYERCFDGVIVETRHMADYVTRCSEIDNRRVHIVESGIEIGQFKPNARPFKSGAQLVIGYIGRLSPEKNPLGFVRLAEALTERSNRLAFKMFGEGNMAREVRQRVESSPARQHIQFVGYVDDVRSAFSEVDVLIVPSTVDGRPGVVMEANACGIPLIANPVRGIPELIQEGVNGYLCKVDDVDRVAALLNNWLTMPESFARSRELARQLALERFSNDRMLSRYAEVLSKYIDQTAATGTVSATANGRQLTAASANS